MAYLLVANLILWAGLAAGAAAFGLHAHRKHRRSRLRSRQHGDPARDYAARRDWGRSTSKLNYSSFVFFDVDRDGRYSDGDRPMSGIVARLAGAGAHILTTRTNGNGFANFIMSVTNRRAHIRSPGRYTFSVSVPPDWICTSGNAVQSRDFRLIQGSPAGIGADEMVKPVGIAPLRMLTGRGGTAAATISVLRGGQRLCGETIAPESGFRVKVPDGADAVAIDGLGFVRTLALTSYPTHLGVLAAEREAIEAGAALETIDFEGVTPRSLRKVPSGHAGLNWFNLNAISRDFDGNEGYVNGNTSGDHTCYTSSGHPAELWSEQPFGFHSVMISVAWLAAEGETARIESWRGDTLLAVDEIAVSALTPVHYAPMLKDVTRIRFTSKHFWQLVIDDLVLAR